MLWFFKLHNIFKLQKLLDTSELVRDKGSE